MPIATLFDEVCARLPLFEDLPPDAAERLSAAGLGRGLATASVRARLRKAGFVDMGVLALATPAALTSVRKIGPVRLAAIRAHVLDALARIYPDARAFHAVEATASRRLDRLRAMPADSLPLEKTILDALGRESCAALAMRGRSECLRTLAVTAGDLDRAVAALTRVLLCEGPRLPEDPVLRLCETSRDEAEALRARMLRERDREWEEAAPDLHSRPS